MKRDRHSLWIALAGSRMVRQPLPTSDRYDSKSKFGKLNLPPSTAASYANYSMLQKERSDSPFFLSGRPAYAKVR